MRMSDEEYFRSCVAKERHLAQLLGHEVEEYADCAGILWINTEKVPQWTRDWRACGALMAQFDIPVAFAGGEDDPHGPSVKSGAVVVHFCDHPDKERAIMAAVVKAVIYRLEHDKTYRHLSHPVRLPGMHHHS